MKKVNKKQFTAAAKAFVAQPEDSQTDKTEKTKQINSKFTEYDYRIICDKAERAGLKPAEYVRECALNGDVVDNKPAELLVGIETEKLFILSKMSNNMNQIARYCNIDKSTDIAVLKYLKQIQQSAFELIRMHEGKRSKLS